MVLSPMNRLSLTEPLLKNQYNRFLFRNAMKVSFFLPLIQLSRYLGRHRKGDLNQLIFWSDFLSFLTLFGNGGTIGLGCWSFFATVCLMILAMQWSWASTGLWPIFYRHRISCWDYIRWLRIHPQFSTYTIFECFQMHLERMVQRMCCPNIWIICQLLFFYIVNIVIPNNRGKCRVASILHHQLTHKESALGIIHL